MIKFVPLVTIILVLWFTKVIVLNSDKKNISFEYGRLLNGLSKMRAIFELMFGDPSRHAIEKSESSVKKIAAEEKKTD